MYISDPLLRLSDVHRLADLCYFSAREEDPNSAIVWPRKIFDRYRGAFSLSPHTPHHGPRDSRVKQFDAQVPGQWIEGTARGGDDEKMMTLWCFDTNR